jgi:RND family efflux transporter MFP subunit
MSGALGWQALAGARRTWSRTLHGGRWAGWLAGLLIALLLVAAVAELRTQTPAASAATAAPPVAATTAEPRTPATPLSPPVPIPAESQPRGPAAYPATAAPSAAAAAAKHQPPATPPSPAVPMPAGEQADTLGVLEPVARTILGAPTFGSIMKILIQEGDTVAEGQVLVQLDDQGRQVEYDRAQLAAEDQSDVEYARLTAEYRLQEYERQKRAYASSTTPTISESDLETYRLNSDLAQTLLKTRRAELALRQKVMETRRYELEITRIRAPFAGTVTRKIAEVGQVAELATPLLELIDSHQLYFVIHLSAAQLPHVAVGQEARVTPELFPELAASGRVVLVGPEVDAASNTVSVKVLVDNSDGKLRPGLWARISFATGGQAKEQASASPSAKPPAATAPSLTEEPKP